MSKFLLSILYLKCIFRLGPNYNKVENDSVLNIGPAFPRKVYPEEQVWAYLLVYL